MEERLPDRIKRHFRENKKLYLGILIGVATAGITLAITKTHGPLPRSGYLAELPRSTKELPGFSSFENISGTVIANNTAPVVFGGYSRKLVQNVSTGEIFSSVGEAAEAAGVSFSKMSRHINGHMDHVNGVLYRIVGIATNA